MKEEEVMLPFPDEALWIADEEVSPNRAADKEDAEEGDLVVSAEDIESTEDLLRSCSAGSSWPSLISQRWQGSDSRLLHPAHKTFGISIPGHPYSINFQRKLLDKIFFLTMFC